MPTNSIFHNIEIESKESANHFAQALENAEEWAKRNSTERFAQALGEAEDRAKMDKMITLVTNVEKNSNNASFLQTPNEIRKFFDKYFS